MKYRGMSEHFTHDQPARVGVLITNLGTPDEPTTPALRRYLDQFLSDPRVIELPRLLWWLILHGIVLRTRPKKSAEGYRSVWSEEGSPLLVHTKGQSEGLKQRLQFRYGQNIEVAYAMRYGNPSIESAIEDLQRRGVRQLLVLPMYPQYSASTTGSTFDALSKDFQQRRWLPDLRFISHYHDFEPYIEAVARKIERYWEENGRPDMLVLSYHGVPKRYLLNGDPYHCECHKTTRLLTRRLGLREGEYMTTFQSRFGNEEWLQPYTDETMKSLPGQGVKRVHVVCPGFSSDCLETIEEIDEENREYFMEAGGEDFHYIPALNSDEDHIDMITTLVEKHLQGWTLPENNPDELAASRERAEALGADQ